MMSRQHEQHPSPADLGAPTEQEIERLSARASPELKRRVVAAAHGLALAKFVSGNNRPWRDLIQKHRVSEPVQVNVDVVEHEGVPRVQVAYIERGFGLSGKSALLFSAIGELDRALQDIEAEAVRRSEAGKQGGRPPTNQEEIRQSLQRAVERYGTKKMMEQPISWIVDRVRFDWQQRDTEALPPSDNTIRRVIALCLPDHPKVKKKLCQKLGS